MATDLPRRPASRASVAQRQLPFLGAASSGAMAAVPACLQVLVAEQTKLNGTGNAAMTEAQVATYEKSGFKSGGNAQQFEAVSWQAGAETDLHEHMETISHDLVVRHLCRENKCESAVFVATGYFKGPALKVWKEAVRVTRAAQAPSQSGITTGSLVYHCLSRMLWDYETKQGKRVIEARMAALGWDPAGVAATRAIWTQALQEAREVEARTVREPPALQYAVPAFPVILASMRDLWPAWAERECVRDPRQFMNIQGMWDTLAQFEPVRGGGGEQGNVHALGQPCQPGEVIHRDDDWRVHAAVEAAQAGDLITARVLLQHDPSKLQVLPEAGGVIHQGHLLALSQLARNLLPLTCFRCRCKRDPHRIAECRAPPSEEEQAGLPRHLWPAVTPVRPGQASGQSLAPPARVGITPTPPYGHADDRVADLIRSNAALRQEFQAFKLQYSPSPPIVPGPTPAAVLPLADMRLADAGVAGVAAAVFCAPRGTPPPLGSMIVARDSNFEWYAPSSTSDSAIDAALAKWPTDTP